MHYKFSETEVNKLLRENFKIIYDTREQANEHILSYFNRKKISYGKQKIDEGDYTAIITKRPEMGVYRDLYFPVAVERKNSVDELAGNLAEKTDTRDDVRLIRELQRAKTKGIKLYLVLEDRDAMENIKMGNYRSLYSPQALHGRFRSIEVKYLSGKEFCTKSEAGPAIHAILYYSLRMFLQAGEFEISPDGGEM